METQDQQRSVEETAQHDVVVLGAGWSGMVATKYMLEEGLSVATLERRDNIGGLWYYSDDKKEKTVMKSTLATSSSAVTEMSDYPMPKEIGMFPHHEEMLTYLHSYSKEFDLLRHVHSRTTVERVEKKKGLWHVSTNDGKTFTSSNLAICTGQQIVNRELQHTLLKDFAGCIYHSMEIKEPLPEFKGKRLLVIGGGETAADICTEWYDHTSLIYWSINRGQHFFRRYTKILPWGRPQALDKASSRVLTTISPYHLSKPGLSWICKWTSNGSILAYQGHGIPEWKSKSEFFHSFVNKSGKVLDLVDYKKLVPKAEIEKCDGKMITFSDGSKQEFDVIILCTGYIPEFPFLPDQLCKKKFMQRYKFIFDNEDPSIAFIGYVRPVVGSITGIAELQARFVAKVFSKHVPFKGLHDRCEETLRDEYYWRNYFKDTSQRLTIVEGYIYVDQIAKLAGIFPNFPALLWKNPYHWYVAMFAPYTNAQYRLNEPQQEEKVVSTMLVHKQGTINPIHLLLILFLRIIWIGSLLKFLEYCKYQIQTSWWWPRIRNLPPIRAVNWIWCIPKRMLFDNKTDVRDEKKHMLTAKQKLHKYL